MLPHQPTHASMTIHWRRPTALILEHSLFAVKFWVRKELGIAYCGSGTVTEVSIGQGQYPGGGGDVTSHTLWS